MHLTRLALLGAALALALPAPLLAQTAVPGPTAASPLGAEALDLERPERLRGLKQVALAGVAVYVITEHDGSATSGAALRGGLAYVNSSMSVTGLAPERLQALADAAHDRLRAALQARGIEVLPQAQLQALPAWAALQAAADSAPLAIDTPGGKGTVYSARGLPLIHLDELGWLHRTTGGLFGAKVEDPYVALGDKMAVGFRKVKLDPALDALSQAAGAPLLMARLVLSAAQVKARGGSFTLGASTESRNSLVLPAWTNRLLVRWGGNDLGRVSLRQALSSDVAPGELVDVTSTGTQVADVLTTALTMAAALSGHGRAVSQRSKTLELRATPDSFEAAAWPQIEQALDGLAAGLQP